MTRLFQTTLLTLCSLASIQAHAQTDPPTANLFTNGGFEKGTEGWTLAAGHQRVVDPTAAHRSKACLTGEVVQPNQALRLKRDITVRANNRYDFQMWARGTKGTKIVLWVNMPGEKKRTMVASWPRVTRKWRRYRATIIPKKSGTLKIEVICPSSYGSPPGRIWVDDLALHETTMPAITAVSTHGFCDEPAMAVAADGTVYVAYNLFHDGWDSLQVVRYRITNDQFESLGRWEVLGGPKTYIHAMKMVSMGQQVALVFASEQQNNWDIYLVQCGADGPTRPKAVTHDRGVDVDPAVAWHNGTLWLAWESNRNRNRQVFARCVQGDQSSEPVALSSPDHSSYDPSLTVLDNSDVCVAWHAFQDNNYDIYLSRRPAAGTWSKPTRLTHAPTIDRHAFLFGRQDQLWLAYENALVQQYHVGATNDRRLLVAKVTPQGLLTPVTNGPSPLQQRCEAASAAFDETGRLWLAMLRPRLPRSGWDTFLTCFSQGRWIKPMPISTHKGMDRLPGLAVQNGRAIVAIQGDDIPPSWNEFDKTGEATSNIFLANVDAGQVSGDATMRFRPIVEPNDPFEAASLRVERGEESPTPSIQYGGKKLNLYFGDLHEHSDIYVCNRVGDQSLDESYQHMRDLTRYDFVCVTDHGYNMNAYLWNYSAKLARINDDPKRFMPFLGQEWTSTFEKYSHQHPYGFYGHRNLILADLYFPRWWNARNYQTPSQVWEDLSRLKANFIHIPHQLADTGNVPTDWSFHDETLQPVAEIFQTRGSYEYFGAPRQAARTIPGAGNFMQDAWALNIIIGVIASPDHGGGYGKACVFAPDLTREAILDALRARHCYGTTAAKIFLDVRVDGHLMGEKIAEQPGKTVTVDIRVQCPADIDRIEVCRSNTFIHTVRPEGRKVRFTFVDRKPLPGTSYYYVRVMQKDQEIAWSSPVWFGTDHEHEK